MKLSATINVKYSQINIISRTFHSSDKPASLNERRNEPKDTVKTPSYSISSIAIAIDLRLYTPLWDQNSNHTLIHHLVRTDPGMCQR